MLEPKRRLWQIHLSTLIVLTLVAGVLMWANVQHRIDARKIRIPIGETEEVKRAISFGVLDGPNYPALATFDQQGWPFDMRSVISITVRGIDDPPSVVSRADLDHWGICWNALVTISILSVTGFGLEWLIRRRGRQP